MQVTKYPTEEMTRDVGTEVLPLPDVSEPVLAPRKVL